MKYILDTNAWVSYLNRSDSPIAAKVAAIAPGDIYLCSVVKAELYFGAFKSAKVTANLGILEKLFARFPSFPLDDLAATHYGRVRAELGRLGTPIGPNDLFIAAIALAEGVTLVTHNVREFARVPGLKFEDWHTGL